MPEREEPPPLSPWAGRPHQATFYVSPAGSDSQPGTEVAPFATIARAQEAVRSVNRSMAGDIVVFLSQGTYQVREAITFGPLDSGTNGHDVVYRSHAGERAIVSGGKAVTAWATEPGGLWKAPVDVSDIRQLYVNGGRARRASILAPAGLEPWSMTGYRTRCDSVADWPSPVDIEFCYSYVWCHTRCKVDSIRRNGEHVEIRMAQPYFVLASTKEGVQIGYPTSVENCLAFLSEPGQWYFDRQTRTLYYKPRNGESIESADVVVPTLETLLELRGSLDDPVGHLRFEGLTFAYATWLRPSLTGLVDWQANFALGPETPLFPREDARSQGCLCPFHAESTKSPANVVCHVAQSVRFSQCTFEHLGGAGIDLEYGSRDNVISGCEFHDISGSAIQVGDVQRHDHHPADPRSIVSGNLVTNNSIHDAATEYKGGVGVFIGYAADTVIAHNEIFDLPYSGISAGWGWGELDAGGGAYVHPQLFDTPTPAACNHIEDNHIHHVMLELNDGGAIYTLGEMPGSVIQGNHIHDNRGHPGGIYLDEGSGHIGVARNVVYNVSKALNFNNRAQNRLATCSIRDNYEMGPQNPAFPSDIARNAGPEQLQGAQIE